MLKWVTDWDVDGEFNNLWDYDRPRHAVLAWNSTYVAVAGVETPAHMDIYGWNDYYRRPTEVDYPTGPVPIDGAGLLHFELGSLAPGASREARVRRGPRPRHAAAGDRYRARAGPVAPLGPDVGNGAGRARPWTSR